MSAGRCYVVCSPENRTFPSAAHLEPPEYWHDVTFVYARNAKRAKVLALRWFRRAYTGRQRWDRFYLSDDTVNPFDGMEARPCQYIPEAKGWGAPDSPDAELTEANP